MIMNENCKIYKFGIFTFRVKEYNLKKGNEELYLRPKTYETLLHLIEHHGTIVKKDDLIEYVWSGTIVTENTLTQCIKEIREKLGDNSAHPRFIKTIPRVGYKFIAPVKEEIIDQFLPYEKSKHFSSKGSKSSKKKIGILLLTVLLVAAIIFFFKDKEPEFNFSERNWVLITDFENQTGQEVFKSALRTALEMELSNSKYVNVVPRGRIQDILNLMKQEPDIRIDRDLGREISLRDGNIQILLTGNIYRIGNSYSLSLKIIEPVTNRMIKNFSQTVTNQEEILPVISQLAISIRKDLGESLENFPKIKGSYEQVTTPSLKALNFYSKGYYYINLFDFDRAEYFLNQAIQYDTTFAMGYTILAFVDLWQGNLLKGKANFGKAAEFTNNLSDREKFFILGSNAMYNIGDYKKAIEYYELLLSVYPDDYWGNENLSIAYLGNGDIKQYLKYKKVCEKLRPNYFINFSDKGLFSLYYDRNVEKANVEFSRALELNPYFPFEFPYLAGAFLDWMHEDVDSAENKMYDFLSFKINKLIPMSRITSRWFLSRFFLFEGRFDEAIKLLKESVTISKQQSQSNLLPWAQLELALVYLEMRRPEEFGTLIKSVAVNSVGIARVQALGWLAIFYAKNGKINETKKLLDELKSENRLMPSGIMQLPLPNELNKAKLVFSYQIEGEIALVNADYNKAIEYFNKVIELVPSSQLPALTALNPRIRWIALKSLAHIYEKMGDWNSTITSYQDIINEKVLTITVPAASSIWVKTLLSMSEVLEKKGNHTEAKIYKTKYTHLWSVNNENKSKTSSQNNISKLAEYELH
jgi:DNA-binding winged helix-turn-helix (wHTH) protein/tetratricopeptide (TPR) repeat protein